LAVDLDLVVDLDGAPDLDPTVVLDARPSTVVLDGALDLDPTLVLDGRPLSVASPSRRPFSARPEPFDSGFAPTLRTGGVEGQPLIPVHHLVPSAA
jgi:hypothetical protein